MMAGSPDMSVACLQTGVLSESETSAKSSRMRKRIGLEAIKRKTGGKQKGDEALETVTIANIVQHTNTNL